MKSLNYWAKLGKFFLNSSQSLVTGVLVKIRFNVRAIQFLMAGNYFFVLYTEIKLIKIHTRNFEGGWSARSLIQLNAISILKLFFMNSISAYLEHKNNYPPLTWAAKISHSLSLTGFFSFKNVRNAKNVFE